MMVGPVTKILMSVEDLLINEEWWGKNSFMATRFGDTHVRFCMVGAVKYVATGDAYYRGSLYTRHLHHQALELLQDATSQTEQAVSTWQDKGWRTHSEVMCTISAALDTAIEEGL
jgi:hypothetical protein